MSNTRIAPTNNRSTIAVMNALAAQGERMFASRIRDLEEVSQMFVGPLEGGSGFPGRELATVLGGGGSERLPSNVIAFPGTHRPEPEPASAGPPNATRTVYQLKVTLQNVKPPVWRRVLVDAGITLDHVHEVIQAAFGWWNHHLHEFEVAGQRYGVLYPDDDWGLPTVDERGVRLDTIATEGSSFTYTYDFGDGWDHRITVEKILPATSDTLVPACIGGRRACPPEDCGGPWGYQDLLVILADPTHPEHRERAEWLGRPFDPEAFDADDFADNLREARRHPER